MSTSSSILRPPAAGRVLPSPAAGKMVPPPAAAAMLVSGGVDSALALALLKEAGTSVEAFYIKIWLQDEFVSLGDCPWEEDLAVLRPITKALGVPLHVLSFQEQYWEIIVEEMIAGIRRGETPNPDILCNSRIKFGAFYETLRQSSVLKSSVVESSGGETGPIMASGHYAQLSYNASGSGSFQLCTSRDPIKDQTYFLARLSQKQLATCYFPLGAWTKGEVREAAASRQLTNAHRPDSQGLCFLGKIRFRDFIRFHLGERSGQIVERETGKILGTHPGYWYYTPGQRQGLDLSTGPWYVSDKDVEANVVYVSRRDHMDERRFLIRDLHWLAEDPFASANSGDSSAGSSLRVKIRHGENAIPCRWDVPRGGGSTNITVLENANKDGTGAEETEKTKETEKTVAIELEQPEMGIAPGQFAVFYQDDVCLGSGIIARGTSDHVASAP